LILQYLKIFWDKDEAERLSLYPKAQWGNLLGFLYFRA
jgi:hypothetical protein